ncbi:putative pentatricopeptide repeat-containing protein At1g03510 [Phoenix dactylifera]|uniref:Pentatricopeptide repeat-containing protein At1g03510 n=1 Tax=Phoenix dactylifera TaxID=42345 RepID=A0A8B9A4X0_PHODC|nr:putative pentatricopeptide repeat-containing protein At1g03510 [Phoenix dactylifera]XP_038981686.1 putative pentatricopeptide repeat-containing protein At1g03510 [Phoenix dactylifera]XP_038981687.1 putative pentatricopeptide repeat-containing protein At1g03510 [Phoenix dactylifera]XP_038981688.1 putative pentatricopeptide repeat-containing protein At1g03510 [Phoenix dactylifera]XP_038981689.1 putative pentatricopeptide repeat-containing protein At1g03510 [Phoenix dactylifera]XP_038981690.1 
MRFLRNSHQRLLAYTKLLTSYVNQGHHHQALTLFSQLFSSPDLALDPYAFPLALKSSAALHLPHSVALIHAHAVKAGLLSNPFVASALVDSCGKCISITSARQLFEECPQRNVVVWNAMISLYSRSNDITNALRLFELMDVTPTESSYNSIIASLAESDDGSSRALGFYRRMQGSGLKPNLITVLALLPACVSIGSLNLIKEVHGFAMRHHIQLHSHLSSGLVEAYGRCGCLIDARKIFDQMPERDVVAWSSMISAYAFHGNARIMMSLLQKMERDSVRPDGIMFLSVLKACSHAGLADDALEYFELMTKHYGVEAGSDHYSCLVDVLSRAGRLNDAHEVLQGMPVKATAKAWGALLGACRNHGEVGLAEIAGRALFEIEPENAGSFVLLSSIYAAAGKYEEAERVRRQMEERGVKRMPGSSWFISRKS